MVVISIADVCSSLKRLNRGETADPDKLNNALYRYYADALAPILAHVLYLAQMECFSVFVCGSEHLILNDNGGFGSTSGSSLVCAPEPQMLIS